MARESGIFDSFLKVPRQNISPVSLLKNFPLLPQELGKAALDVRKTVAVDTGKIVVEILMQPKTKNKVENIVSKYTDDKLQKVSDHCHIFTGKFRGAAHGNCNQIIKHQRLFLYCFKTCQNTTTTFVTKKKLGGRSYKCGKLRNIQQETLL